MSIFPFEKIKLDGLDALRVVRLLRLIKLGKLSRIARMGNMFNIGSQELQLFFFGGVLFFLIHWIACAWCLIAQLEVSCELREMARHRVFALLRAPTARVRQP